jgi:rhamnosyltransferase
VRTATPEAAIAGCGSRGDDTVVACVVVTYNPDSVRLQQLLDAVLPQVDSVRLIDNGSAAEVLAWLRGLADDGLQLLELGENKGIAAAMNAGIAAARADGCSHILLLDHDSVPAPSMVDDLLRALAIVRPEGRGVAAVGPRYLDERQDNPPPFIRVRGLRVERCPCPTPDTIVAVDYLISSGSLIPCTTLDAVGGMAEELFIDYVDIEWGLRARRLGFQSYGVCAAQMAHDLGDAPIEFMGRRLPLHSPLRHYYHFRNAVWLYRSRDLPLHWKCADGWRLLLKYGFYTLFATPRIEHLRMMSRGIVDGLRGRMGRWRQSAPAAKAAASRR